MIIKAVAALVMVAAGWLGTLATAMIVNDSAPAALVLLPSQAFLSALPADAAILSQNAISITLAADTPLPLRLYNAGAWLVLPAGLSGCATV
ncbi:MAG: hypothetical protein AB3N11_06785 [Arenibacterium sp.]